MVKITKNLNWQSLGKIKKKVKSLRQVR